jgi:hypothetical protein
MTCLERREGGKDVCWNVLPEILFAVIRVKIVERRREYTQSP